MAFINAAKEDSLWNSMSIPTDYFDRLAASINMGYYFFK